MGHEIDEETAVEKQTANADVKSRKGLYFVVLVGLGLLNNFGYVLVNSSAQRLGDHFNEGKLMSLFTFALTLLGAVTSFVNSKYLLKIRHFTKIQIMLAAYSLAYLCVGISSAIDNLFGFALCLFGSIVMGAAQALGEQTNLGFLKGFAPELIGAWGCGTGFAGVFGAGINFLLRFVDVPGYAIFIGMIPTNLLYLLGFMWLKNQKVHQLEKVENTLIHRPDVSIASIQGDQRDKHEADINQALSVENFKRVWPMIWSLAFNLAAVYFLEYGINSGFADVATHPYTNSDVEYKKDAFIILNLCYQLGVLISRSSLAVIKIKKVWIVSLLQLINYIVWAWIAYNQNVTLGVLFGFMIWVGLMGGASYVNVLYLILESDDLEKKDKEVSINILSIFNSFGILATTLLATLFENTIYADK